MKRPHYTPGGQRFVPASLGASLLALVGCTGTIVGGAAGGDTGGGGAGGGDGTPSLPTIAPAKFECNPAALVASPGLRRLTATQYRNTLRDVLGFALGGNAAEVNAVLNAATVATALDRFPRDERQKVPQDLHGSYRRLDQSLQQVHVDAGYEIALGVAAALATPARFGVLLGTCATDADRGNDDACLTNFIQKFGERVARRPLAADEVAFYKGFYAPSTGIDATGLTDVIAGLLASPEFLYVIEHGEEPVAGKPDVFSLSAYELASRLSFQFWQTMPDSALFEAARSGTLATPAGYEAQLDRIFADQRTRGTLDEFFTDAFKLEDLKPLHQKNDDPVFRAFAGDNLPTASLHQSMIEDVLGLIRYTTWDKPGTLDDLYTSELSFAQAPELASIYGVPVWAPGNEPPSFTAGTRPGLLTRALFLATGIPNTRPVMKGVFIRTSVLCDEIPPPPNNANAVVPPLDPTLSTRQVVESLTEQPNTACASCHATYINPLGFATENFDALGRLRSEQRLFDPDGREVGQTPVNTVTVPRVDSNDATPSQGPADLARMIASSGRAHACFARNYFRFSFGRWEDLASDGCALERMRTALEQGGRVQDMLKSVALDPTFQQRSFK